MPIGNTYNYPADHAAELKKIGLKSASSSSQWIPPFPNTPDIAFDYRKLM